MNSSHSSACIADKLVEICSSQFNIDLPNSAKGGGSDTASAARAVQSVLNVEQDDCTMHVVSLILAYTIGMNENYQTTTKIDNDGKKVKIRCIVTPGGPFPFGAETCKFLRDLSNSFSSSPIRKEEFQKLKKSFILPMQTIKNPGETRVSSHVTLLQTAMMNYFALTVYSIQTDDEVFKNLWAKYNSDCRWKVCGELN